MYVIATTAVLTVMLHGLPARCLPVEWREGGSEASGKGDENQLLEKPSYSNSGLSET